MSFPVRNLPVIQNWDCHVCGSCCKEYVVTVTEDERRRIEAQDWSKDPEIGDLPIFTRSGPWWNRRYHLNHLADGSCVFLSKSGRCRMHERFGYQSKPLPCRMFPFVLVPAGDHWRVGMRFACPSAAGNKGRAVAAHEETLKTFAAELIQREGLDKEQQTAFTVAPRLQRGQQVDWPDVMRLVRVLLEIIKDRNDRIERRIRKCLALVELCRVVRFDDIQGKRLDELLAIFRTTVDANVPVDPTTVPAPGWVGRILFRQAVALFTRKDHGPDQGVTRHGRSALLLAAWRFARGRGSVPRLHNKLPETTFEAIESRSGKLPDAAEEILERYYTIKVQSLQFFGPTNFQLPFWDGFELLALTLPVFLWVARANHDVPPVEAVTRALTIVDDHFGYNKVLRTGRQRVSFKILARTGELSKLIAWYSR